VARAATFLRSDSAIPYSNIGLVRFHHTIKTELKCEHFRAFISVMDKDFKVRHAFAAPSEALHAVAKSACVQAHFFTLPTWSRYLAIKGMEKGHDIQAEIDLFRKEHEKIAQPLRDARGRYGRAGAGVG
jgi:hypothetical protein